MIKIDVAEYIQSLKNDADPHSIKKELKALAESDAFEKMHLEAAKTDIRMVEQIKDMSVLLRIKNLASEIGSKKIINEKLHSLHFNLCLGKNNSFEIGRMFEAFLFSNETGIGVMVDDLNEFKKKLDEIGDCHSKMLPKGLDNKLLIDERYSLHLKKLHEIHKKQKELFLSMSSEFLKVARKHIKSAKI